MHYTWKSSGRGAVSRRAGMEAVSKQWRQEKWRAVGCSRPCYLPPCIFSPCSICPPHCLSCPCPPQSWAPCPLFSLPQTLNWLVYCQGSQFIPPFNLWVRVIQYTISDVVGSTALGKTLGQHFKVVSDSWCLGFQVTHLDLIFSSGQPQVNRRYTGLVILKIQTQQDLSFTPKMTVQFWKIWPK